MTQYNHEPEESIAGTHVSRTHKTTPTWIKWSAVIVIWGLLIYASYSLAQHYFGEIRQQLSQIQKTNETNVQALHAKIENLETTLRIHNEQTTLLQEQFSIVETELGAVKEEMSLAGDTLSTTADTKQALGERITALSKELGELRKLIKKLEEAARVY